MLKKIRNSPAFWEEHKKKGMAMLRQIGCPTFFLTLSAAESRWEELLVMLKKTVYNEDITEEQARNMRYQEKYDLIRKDPVTCAQYFKQRSGAVFNLLKREGSPFHPHPLVDFQKRDEFQHRGSAHLHSVLWLQDSPRFVPGNADSERECIQFIDRYITCAEDGAPAELVAYQRHKHTACCSRVVNRKKVCRFGFPLFPMSQTRILHPLDLNERQQAIDVDLTGRLATIKRLLTHLWKRRGPITESFQDMLRLLNLSEADYIMAIRSSLKSTKVFLRRKPSEIKINPYNPELL